MKQIAFTTIDPIIMQQLMGELQNQLAQAGITEELSVETRTPNAEITRGADLTAVLTVALGASGAFTVFLSKDSILDSFARLIEKYIESRKVTVAITENGETKDIQVTGSLSDIKKVLKALKD